MWKISKQKFFQSRNCNAVFQMCIKTGLVKNFGEIISIFFHLKIYQNYYTRGKIKCSNSIVMQQELQHVFQTGPNS